MLLLKVWDISSRQLFSGSAKLAEFCEVLDLVKEAKYKNYKLLCHSGIRNTIIASAPFHHVFLFLYYCQKKKNTFREKFCLQRCTWKSHSQQRKFSIYVVTSSSWFLRKKIVRYSIIKVEVFCHCCFWTQQTDVLSSNFKQIF